MVIQVVSHPDRGIFMGLPGLHFRFRKRSMAYHQFWIGLLINL